MRLIVVRHDPRLVREPLPFEDLFLSIINEARNELRQRAGPELYKLCTPQAHTGWERYLLARLCWISAKAAHRQFEIYKSVSIAFRKGRPDDQPRTDQLYRAFLGRRTEDRLERLLSDFPQLRQLQGDLVRSWMATVDEFLTRLKKDRDELGKRFGLDQNLGPVTAVRAGLSDPHNCGRTVARIEFADGLSVVYKPRSLSAEVHFSKLIEEVNAVPVSFSLRAAKAWDCLEYGWMEDISPSECVNVEGVHTFYWRAGALLCLVHLSNGVDMHSQNMIAAGEFPVLIDLESLWHPQEHVDSLPARNARSVVRTGFLGGYVSEVHAAYKWSVFGRKNSVEHASPGWRNVNQDEMAWEANTKLHDESSHLPKVRGDVFPSSEFIADIQAGFRCVAERLMSDARAKRRFRRWLRTLIKCRRRRILRSSTTYYVLLERLTCPSFQRTHFPKNNWPEVGRPTSLSSEEMRALQRLDIPHFLQDTLDEDPQSRKMPLPSRKQVTQQLAIIAQHLSGSPDLTISESQRSNSLTTEGVLYKESDNQQPVAHESR